MVVLLLAAPRTVGDPSARDTYRAHLATGDRFYHQCDNIRALAEYKEAYMLASDSFSTIQRLVNIYNDLGRLSLRKDTASESYYRIALAFADSLNKYFPDRAESHFWLALCEGSLIPFVGTKEKILISRDVLTEANRATQIDSNFALAYVVIGIFQRETSKLSWFERLIVRMVYGSDLNGSLSASESYLLKSVSLDPENSYGFYELYWTYQAMKDHQKARRSLEMLLTIPPSNERERQQAEDARRRLAMLTAIH